MAKGFSMQKIAAQAGRRFAVPGILAGVTALAMIRDIWSYDYMTEMPLLPMILFCGLCFSTAGALLAEALDKPRARPLFSAAGAAFGVLMMLCFSGTKTAGTVCGLLALSAALFSCACISRGERRAERLGHALGCVLTSAGISTLVFLLLTLLISAVRTLFLNSAAWRTFDRITGSGAVLSYLFIAPLLLFALLPEADASAEKQGWLRKLLAWAVLPAYLVLLAILAGYIALILLRWEMPVGQMNPYALTALCFYTALHLLLTGEENAIARFFRRWGAWPLLPVIAAQAVGVAIRVSAYGLTESRIYGLMLTAVCLYPVVAGMLRRRANGFLVISAALALVLAVPAVSPRTLTRLNHEARLYAALERADMLDANGSIRPGAPASGNDRSIIWSSARLLYVLYDDHGDTPADSKTADLIRQLNATDPEGKSSVTDKIRALVGFDQADSENRYRHFTARGAYSTDRIIGPPMDS